MKLYVVGCKQKAFGRDGNEVRLEFIKVEKGVLVLESLFKLMDPITIGLRGERPSAV